MALRAHRFFDQRANDITANPLSLEARSQIKLLEKKGVRCWSCRQPADIFCRNGDDTNFRQSPLDREVFALICYVEFQRIDDPRHILEVEPSAEGEISSHRWAEGRADH